MEIELDGVQTSTRYPGGVALRFARVVRYRDDKTAAEADTLETVRALKMCSERAVRCFYARELPFASSSAERPATARRSNQIVAAGGMLAARASRVVPDRPPEGARGHQGDHDVGDEQRAVDRPEHRARRRRRTRRGT